jgi:hypothetical protein
VMLIVGVAACAVRAARLWPANPPAMSSREPLRE